MKREEKSVDDLMLEQQAETLEREEQALVAWSNTFLARRQMEAATLVDFADGVLLINLAEVAFGERVGPYKLRPKLLAHRLDNVSTVLDYLRQRGVTLISVSSQDVVDGKIKQCVNVLWNLLRRLTLRGLEMLRGEAGAGAGASSASQKKETVREAILGWANESMPDVAISDFGASFRDGVALCHIVNNLVPGSIDVAGLSAENSMENLTEALRVAEEELGIPSLLTVDDFLQGSAGPDETAVENYVCMLVSAAQARGRNEAEVAKLREQAQSARARQEQELERLRREAEDERSKFASVAADLERLRLQHDEHEAGAAELQESLDRARAEKAELLAALDSLRADGERTHERLEAAHRHEQELLGSVDGLQTRLAEAQALLKERDDELNAANAEMYRLHKEQENVLHNVRSELQLQTITENEDAAASEAGSDAGIDDIFRRRILEQRGYSDFVAMLRDKKGWLMKRRPGGGGKKFFGTDKKKRFFAIKGDELFWYKAEGDQVEKGKAKLKYYQKVDFQMPDNDPEAKFYGNSRGSIADNKVVSTDGKEEEIVMRLVPRDGVKESQAKVMELTAVQTMVPEMQENIVAWIEEINTRISLIGYLQGMFSKQGQTSREVVEFVVRGESELRLENSAFDSHDAFTHFRECLIMRKGLRVHLANVALSDPSVRILADVLRHNNTAAAFEFPRNLLTADSARDLADAMRRNSSLEALVLDGNRIEDAGVEALADAVSTHRGLRTLSLNAVAVSDRGVEALVDGLLAAADRFGPSQRAFPAVLLARNRVGDAGAAAVARLIAADKSVRTVNLENNLVTDAGASSLADALADSGVEELNLAGNQISSKGLAAVADAVRKTGRSIAIEVSRNPLITADGARSLLRDDISLSFHKMAFVKSA